ncbi:hypothetical protein QUF58_03205 [Anaerolineales bacterium HSG24]|nr:hypothetical protein [Anaerolineales bacterium HSG24]
MKQLSSIYYRNMVFMMILLAAMLAGTAQAQEANICATVSEIPQAECEALVMLYENTSSSGWTERANWLLGTNPCEWHGVTCQDEQVTMLALSSNDLAGQIPAEIGNLSALKVLDLADNNLTGEIPAEIGQLSQLKWLYLNDNDLSGRLPSTVQKLDKLEILWLYNTNVCVSNEADVTAWLSDLPNLQLSSSCMSEKIADSPSITEKVVTQIECAEISAATELSELECQALLMLYSNTDGANWSNNENWTQTDDPCGWHGVTCEDDQVTKLELNGNNLSGDIPAELGDLSTLTELQLADNQLSGRIPPELGQLEQLTKLGLSNNPLEGPVPGNLINLPLEEFGLANTNMCQPKNSTFGAWFDKIEGLVSNIPSCDQVDLSMADQLVLPDAPSADDEVKADETVDSQATDEAADETVDESTDSDTTETDSDETSETNVSENSDNTADMTETITKAISETTETGDTAEADDADNSDDTADMTTTEAISETISDTITEAISDTISEVISDTISDTATFEATDDPVDSSESDAPSATTTNDDATAFNPAVDQNMPESGSVSPFAGRAWIILAGVSLILLLGLGTILNLRSKS